uniref:Uncharacterized protein n=1 Tax=Candidatus Methanophagaceae archaeon ANME-1 ERB6 TaxID=2759912 RepID=A0A7G9YYW6_9EURY|nr:hypothetical protein NDOAJMFA_00050 [Methanosarcinales archaeon ANME-1 ERB6]
MGVSSSVGIGVTTGAGVVIGGCSTKIEFWTESFPSMYPSFSTAAEIVYRCVVDTSGAV